jgi:hypothetical protein
MPPFSSDNPQSISQKIPTVSVTTGSVEPDGIQAKTSLSDEPLGVYTDYVVKNRYERDRHVYMTPIASPNKFQGSSVAFVQLSSPTLLWIMDWTASRILKQPLIPDSTPPTSDWILLDEHMEPVNMELMADGVTPRYRISGTYVYGHKNPNVRVHKDASFPQPPWMDGSFPNGRNVPDSSIQKGIAAPLGVKAAVTS